MVIIKLLDDTVANHRMTLEEFIDYMTTKYQYTMDTQQTRKCMSDEVEIFKRQYKADTNLDLIFRWTGRYNLKITYDNMNYMALISRLCGIAEVYRMHPTAIKSDRSRVEHILNTPLLTKEEVDSIYVELDKNIKDGYNVNIFYNIIERLKSKIQ